MSTMYGADVAQLRALAAQFEAIAERLENCRIGVGSMVHASPWSGPDAALFRQDWDSQHAARIVQACRLLRDGAMKLRGNADSQEQASAVEGGWNSGGWSVPTDLTPDFSFRIGEAMGAPDIDPWRASLDWIDGAMKQHVGDTGWSLGDLGGLVPKLGTALGLMSAADRAANGEFPWHDLVDLGAGVVKGLGGGVSYGIGVDMALWADVVDLGTNGDIDWSPEGMQDAFNGLFNADAWKEVGHDLITKLPPILAGDLAWW